MDRPQYEINVVRAFLPTLHQKAFDKIIEYLDYRVKQLSELESENERLKARLTRSAP